MVGKRTVMMLCITLFLLSATAFADTVNRDVLLDFNYTIDSTNVTGNVTFFYPNGTNIKTTVFNIGTKLSSALQASTNVSFTYLNASGGMVDCGDQVINLPAVSCQPQYTFNEQPCPALPPLPNCSLACPAVDNQPLIELIGGVNQKLNPGDDEVSSFEKYLPWVLVALCLVVIGYLLFGRKQEEERLVRQLPPEQPRFEEPARMMEIEPPVRTQALPVSRHDVEPVRELPKITEYPLENITAQPHQNTEPVRPPVVRPVLRQPADIESLRQVSEPHKVAQPVVVEQSPEEVRRAKIEAKMKLLKNARR